MQQYQRKAACPARPLPKTFTAFNKRLGGRIPRFGIRDAADRLIGDVPGREVLLLLLEERLGRVEERLGRVKEVNDLTVAKMEEQLGRAEEQLGRAEERLGRAALEKQLVEKDLLTVTAELLFVRGLLHMRGLLEYAEKKLSGDAGSAAPRSRQEAWESILQRNAQLLTCAKGCVRGKRDYTSVARNITSIYGSLSGHIHNFSRTAVDIVEGPLNKEQMRLLECIATAANVPYNVVNRPETDVAAMMSDQSSSGAVSSDGDSGVNDVLLLHCCCHHRSLRPQHQHSIAAHKND